MDRAVGPRAGRGGGVAQLRQPHRAPRRTDGAVARIGRPGARRRDERHAGEGHRRPHGARSAHEGPHFRDHPDPVAAAARSRRARPRRHRRPDPRRPRHVRPHLFHGAPRRQRRQTFRKRAFPGSRVRLLGVRRVGARDRHRRSVRGRPGGQDGPRLLRRPVPPARHRSRRLRRARDDRWQGDHARPRPARCAGRAGHRLGRRAGRPEARRPLHRLVARRRPRRGGPGADLGGRDSLASASRRRRCARARRVRAMAGGGRPDRPRDAARLGGGAGARRVRGARARAPRGGGRAHPPERGGAARAPGDARSRAGRGAGGGV